MNGLVVRVDRGARGVEPGDRVLEQRADRLRLAIGLVKPSMIDAGVFTPAQFGIIGSAFFYTYALGKLTNGFLADHANMRTFLPLGFAMSALCNFGMGFADTVLMAAILWGVNGWFQGFGAPGSVVAIVSSITSQHQRGVRLRLPCPSFMIRSKR